MNQRPHQKKIAVIGDFTGFGRCSLTVSIPILSVMGIQVCPLPTSIFSNHTAYPSFFFDDYTEKMAAYMEEWRKLGLTFDGICTGFLGSGRQIEIVARFIEEFRGPDTLVVMDPVMGDMGRAYSTCTPELCREMARLVRFAGLLTPNVTEACLLTGASYQEGLPLARLAEIAEELSRRGPEKVVITGIPQGEYLANLCYEKDGKVKVLRSRKAGASRCGTGDIFASILAGDALNGVPLEVSVERASRFIQKCILRSMEYDIPLTDGVCFEEFLGSLAPGARED